MYVITLSLFLSSGVSSYAKNYYYDGNYINISSNREVLHLNLLFLPNTKDIVLAINFADIVKAVDNARFCQ